MIINIAIVNPPAKKIVEPYYDEPSFPRTALAFLAGHLRDNLKDCKIFVKDSKFDKCNIAESVDFIIKNNIQIVGLTAMTNEINSAAELAREIKNKNQKIITVIGGVHVTALPEETMRENPEFDFGVLGEGEQTFLDLILSIRDKSNQHIKGVCFLKDNLFMNSGAGVPLGDQDSLKPAWDMFRPAKEYMLQTSRGCPFSCNFCMNPGGRIVRARSIKTTLDEIGYIVENMKPKSIYFGDEIFTVNRERAKEICRGMISRGYHKKVKWWCQTHVNTLDREIINLMKKAGCILVGLGIETGDDEIFKKMGKGINKQKIKKAINLLKEEKLNFDCMFILGQPNETFQSAKNTIDFAIELNPATPIFGLMVPYPGTKVGAMALNGQSGYKLLTKNWDDFNKQIGNCLELEGISRVELERLQFYGYIKVFLYNLRVLDFIKFCFLYRKEGFIVLKKIATGR